MSELHKFSLIGGSLVGIALAAQPVSAKALPAHLCALLPAAVVSSSGLECTSTHLPQLQPTCSPN